MTYADSATAGASITINVTGTYTIDRVDFFSGANADVGMSVNSNQLATNCSTITAANRIAIIEFPTITTTAVASSGSSASAISRTRYFTVGDVIRPHDNLQNDTTSAVYSWMAITRVN